jgi:transcription antitermination factor NusG
VGEFLSLLKTIDSEQVKELKAGSEEVRELTGLEIPSDPINTLKRDREVNVGEAENKGVVEEILKDSKKYIVNLRIFRKHLPVSMLGAGTKSY